MSSRTIGESPRSVRLWPHLVVWGLACCCLPSVRSDDARTDDPASADERLAVGRAAMDPAAASDEALGALAREAEADGFARLAPVIESLRIPVDDGRLLVILPGPVTDAPPWLEAKAAPLWERLVALRREHARRHFERAAVLAASPGVREASADRNDAGAPADRPAGWEPAVAESAEEALRLVARALWLDPQHEPARALAGWVRHEGRWVRPEAARRLARGEVFREDFGWIPADRAARYEAGERYERGRWVPAAEVEAEKRTIHDGWRYASDHWQLVSSAPLTRTSTLAATLEEAHMIWTQVYAAYSLSASDVRRRFAGRGRQGPIGPLTARLVASKEEYVAELERLEPAVGRTLGIYWSPTRTAWFFDPGDGPDAATVLHEAVHQLFAESRKTGPAVGERAGFWAVEAAACFVESARKTHFGWTVGGRDAGRAPMARRRLLEDDFHVPLAEVVSMGRRELQADSRLPRLYSQISGLADFFMTGERGRLRSAFVEYLARLYAGRVEAGTLAALCGCSYGELDDRYRRHMARDLPGAAAVR